MLITLAAVTRPRSWWFCTSVIEKVGAFMKGDVINLLDCFNLWVVLIWGYVTLTCLSLPMKDTSSVHDFRPVSLINSSLKDQTKILANRLKEQLHSVICESQGVFIKGKRSLYVVRVANEVLDCRQNQGRLWSIFKLTFRRPMTMSTGNFCWIPFITWDSMRSGIYAWEDAFPVALSQFWWMRN